MRLAILKIKFSVVLADDYNQTNCRNAISLYIKVLGLCNSTIFQAKQNQAWKSSD